MGLEDEQPDVPRHSLDYAPAEEPERLTPTFWAVTLILIGVGVLLVDVCSAVKRGNRLPPTSRPSVSPPAARGRRVQVSGSMTTAVP